MRVLIVHRYFWPEQVTVMADMLRMIAELHLARGDTVRVVAGESGDFGAARRTALPGAEIAAFRAPIDREGGMARRLLTSLRLARHALGHARDGRWDVVYAVSYPPGLAALIALAGRARHLVFYLQDNFAWRLPGPLRAPYRGMMRFTLRRAARTITLTGDMRSELLGWFRDPREVAPRILVMQNVVPGLGARLEAGPEVRDIVYAGNHGPAQNLGHFLDALRRMDRVPRVAFYGSGAEREALVRRAEGLPGVSFHDTVPREAARAEIARSRLGLVGARPDLLRHAFPSKLLAYAAEGTPSLLMCPEGSEAARWLAETGLGMPLDPADPGRAAAGIAAALAAPADRDAIAARARAEFGAERWLAAIGAMLDGLDGA